MKIPSGSVNRYVYFVAVDPTDYKTKETGLSAFTVVFSRNGSADTTMTTPTIVEVDAATMPGVYALLLDEGTTLTAGNDSEEVCYYITEDSSAMASVTRTIELYRLQNEAEGNVYQTLAEAYIDALETTLTAVLLTDTNTEGSTVPAANASIRDMLQFLFYSVRNKRITTAASQVIKKDDGTTNLASAALSDASASFTKGKYS
jgi:hypothetical protein